MHYASFVEDQQGRPAARTLQRFVGVLRRAARSVLTETDAERQAEALLGIRTAVAARERLEADRSVLSRYFELYLVRGRAPLIPRGLRIIDRQIRWRASSAIRAPCLGHGRQWRSRTSRWCAAKTGSWDSICPLDTWGSR